jgi:O-antigen/teichoic acid export membrane protein
MPDGSQTSSSGMVRGTLWYFAGYALLFVCNYLIHIFLARNLLVYHYGVFGVTIALISVWNTVMYDGMEYSVAKRVAESSAAGARGFVSAAMNLQAVFSIVLVVLLVASAGSLAGMLGNPEYASLLSIGAFSIVPTALLSVLLGTMSGSRKFGKHAFIFGLNSAVKPVLVIGCVLAGFHLRGAIVGWSLSLVPGLLVAVLWRERLTGLPGPAPYRAVISFAAPLTALHAVYALMMNVDIVMVQAIQKNSLETGLYTAAAALAKPTWMFFSAIVNTLLPSVSRSTSANDTERTRSYIRASLRYLLLMLVPVIAILCGFSRQIIELLYSTSFTGASRPMEILCLAMGAFSVYLTMNAVVTASGRPLVSLLFGAGMLALDIALLYVLVPRYGITGAALAVGTAFWCGAGALCIYIYRSFRCLTYGKSVVKITATGMLVYFCAKSIDAHGLWCVAAAAGCAAVYGLVLIAVKEITAQDRDFVLNALRR